MVIRVPLRLASAAIGLTLVIVVALTLAGGAAAAEPMRPAFNGAIELKGSHGFRVLGFVASTGTVGVVTLLIRKDGETAVYSARGQGTQTSVDVGLGKFGKVEVEAVPTGGQEKFTSGCEGKGKAVSLPDYELVGTIEFHGEEGFTEFTSTRTPLLYEPLLNLVCGQSTVTSTSSGSHVSGVELKAKFDGGHLLLSQNRPGARVFYEAKEHEKVGTVSIVRSVEGRIAADSLSYFPSLATANFAPGAPFTGKATYAEGSPPSEARPVHGTWRGSLKVDFPGDANVPLAGPGVEATIIHAKRTETHE
jgi:hypothetical protein